MEPKPRRQIPKVLMLVVPLVTLGLAITVVSLAWHSSRSRQDGASASTSTPAPDDVGNAVFLECVNCHNDLDRVFKEGEVTNLLYRHQKHFAKGVSECAVCHPANTHEPDAINKPTMSRCFICHGPSAEAIAPGTCATCHPPGTPRQPTSHLSKGWATKAHGPQALEDRFQCLTCHQQTTCDTCHGLEIPHAADWKEAPHATTYFAGSKVCARCHVTPAIAPAGTKPSGRSLCDTCHHPQGPDRSVWLGYHSQVVKSDGASACFTCHATNTCATCHKTGQLDLTADRQLFLQNGGGDASPAA